MKIRRHTISFIILLLLSQFVFSQQDTAKEKPTHIFKFNITKLLVGELTFSYESRIKKQPYEIELSYVYPMISGNNAIRLPWYINPNISPTFCYNGGSLKCSLKLTEKMFL